MSSKVVCPFMQFPAFSCYFLSPVVLIALFSGVSVFVFPNQINLIIQSLSWKFVVSQLFNKIPAFYVSWRSTAGTSQFIIIFTRTTIGPYSESVISNPHFQTLSHKVQFLFYLRIKTNWRFVLCKWRSCSDRSHCNELLML